MVIDLIHSFANQLLRERINRWFISSGDGTAEALLMVAGERFREVLGPLIERESVKLDLSYAKCVSYGVNPVRLRSTKVVLQNPYKTTDDHGFSDPLILASFFATYGMREDAMLMLDEREKYIAAYARWVSANRPEYMADPELGGADFGRNFAPRDMLRTIVIPDFEELRLPRVQMHQQLDTFYLEGAFEVDHYTDMMKRRITPTVVDAFTKIISVKGKRINAVLRKVAYEQARNLTTSDKAGGFRYSDMATYVRLCDAESASSLFDDLRGARQMIALVRHDTATTHYTMGLRQLAQAAPAIRKEILERVGRGPTVEEVRSVRSIGIINILDEMDWELIAPIVHESGLRAAALPYAEKLGPTVLRRFLTDHAARVRRLPNPDTDPESAARSLRVTDALSISDWEPAMEKLVDLYNHAAWFRKAIVDAAEGSELVAFLAVLSAHRASSPDIERVVAQHPNWERIRDVLADYRPPDLKKVWS